MVIVSIVISFKQCWLHRWLHWLRFQVNAWLTWLQEVEEEDEDESDAED